MAKTARALLEELDRTGETFVNETTLEVVSLGDERYVLMFTLRGDEDGVASEPGSREHAVQIGKELIDAVATTEPSFLVSFVRRMRRKFRNASLRDVVTGVGAVVAGRALAGTKCQETVTSETWYHRPCHSPVKDVVDGRPVCGIHARMLRARTARTLTNKGRAAEFNARGK